MTRTDRLNAEIAEAKKRFAEDFGFDYSDVEALQRLATEPLLPELEEYVDWVAFDGKHPEEKTKVLRSPLVYEVPLMLPGQANIAYRKKAARLEELIAKNDLSGVVWLHERPWRVHALLEYVVGWDEFGLPRPLQKCPPEVRELASHVWTDSENIEQWQQEWSHLFWGGGWLFGDREAFDALPDPITIYRGDIADGGWSWSTDLRIAQWFARRFDATDDLVYATVEKEHVFAYLTSRSESEILVRLDAPITIIKRVPYDVWIKEANSG